MAYSPLGRGLLANTDIVNQRFYSLGEGDFRHFLPRFNDPKNLESNKKRIGSLETLAQGKNVTVSQIALAWLLHQAKVRGIQVIPIPGTKNIKFLEDNYNAAKILLSQEEADRISSSIPFNAVQGERWPDSVAKYGVRFSSFEKTKPTIFDSSLSQEKKSDTQQ